MKFSYYSYRSAKDKTKQNKQTEKSFSAVKTKKCQHWKILEALKFSVK